MSTFAYIWPLALVVLSNVVYHICTKSAPEGMHPLASLTVTYLTGAVLSAVLYCFLERGGSLIRECGKLSSAPFLLGIAIVGLEAGYLYAYRAGWPVSTAAIVQSAFLTIALVFVGRFLYHETLSVSKLVGIGFCLVGLVFLNRK